MKRLLASLCVFGALGGELFGAPPNVVIVMTDDQGLGDFSFTGNPVLKTPAFDSFARQSVRLTDFHVCPMCSPTRGQLMTGLSAVRNGATSVTAGRTFMRPGLPTLPEAFAAGGYKTGLFGKWHLGDHYPHRPMDRGFQEAAYHLGWGQQQSTPEYDYPLIDGRYFHNGTEKRYKGHCTDLWFDLATAWMKERKAKGEPFLCYLPTNAPHAPHVELPEYVKPYQGKGPAGFFGMIAHLDKRFGDLMRFLDDEKLAGDTIVIFMTDNGGTAGVQTFNAGLRAGKTTYYDGGHRVPCWVRWPNGKLGDPRDIDTPTQNTDLFPTLCELCGLAPPPATDAAYRGVSLAGLLRGGAIADRKFVVQYGQTPTKHEACVVWGKWRLVKGAELYDVVADRAQKADLAAQHPDVVKALRDYYDGWWKGVEPLVSDFVTISLGAKQQPVVEMTSGDWQDIYADNSGYVRQAVGGPTGGIWHVKVEEAGEYTFTLRRWPEQTGVALGAKHEPSDKSPANKKAPVVKGFPTIAQAHLAVGGVTASGPADPKATGATLAVTLPTGPTTLKAWFADAQGQPLCGAFFVTITRKEKPAPKPNLLVILADDLGWSDLGCFGGEIETPNLDKLAAGGLRFTQFYSSSRCSPTRASLLTGLHPHQAGFPNLSGALPPHCVTLPEALAPAGYRSSMVGKWHLNGQKSGPVARGFADYYGMLGGFDTFWDERPYTRRPADRPKRTYPPGGFYATDVFADYALDFLKQSAGKPWLLYLAFNAPHFPLHAPEADVAKYEPVYAAGWDAIRARRLAKQKELGLVPANLALPPREVVPANWANVASPYRDKENPAWDSLPADRRADLARRMAVYAAMVDRLDRAVGRVVADLRERGELDNTLILFLSDNGACAEWDPFGFDGKSGPTNTLHVGADLKQIGTPGSYVSYGSGWAGTCNTPWRLYKHYAHEGGLSVPGIAHWPAGLKRAGQADARPLHVHDVLPTCLELVGASYPAERNGVKVLPVEGRSFAGAFRNEPAADRSLFFEHEGHGAVHRGNWKLVNLAPGKWELYDLAADRVERHDLASANPALVAELAGEYAGWAKRVGLPPVPGSQAKK